MSRLRQSIAKVIPWSGNANGPLNPLSLDSDLRILQAGTPRMRKSILIKADNPEVSDERSPVLGRVNIARGLISEKASSSAVLMPDQWRSRVFAYLQLISDIINLLITPFCRKSPRLRFRFALCYSNC
jgi:hypothetical protein